MQVVPGRARLISGQQTPGGKEIDVRGLASADREPHALGTVHAPDAPLVTVDRRGDQHQEPIAWDDRSAHGEI